jgi:hypothetical protein
MQKLCTVKNRILATYLPGAFIVSLEMPPSLSAVVSDPCLLQSRLNGCIFKVAGESCTTFGSQLCFVSINEVRVQFKGTVQVFLIVVPCMCIQMLALLWCGSGRLGVSHVTTQLSRMDVLGARQDSL